MHKLLIGIVAGLLASGAEATVAYGIDLRTPEHHTATVTATFPVTAEPYLDVKMPAWRTGRYTIMNLASGVSQFTASDASGRPLDASKIDKSTWRIRLPRASAVTIRYELYGNELGSRSRHIDDSHAYLDASAVLMYADRYRADDVRVRLQVPAGWRSFSGMDSPASGQFVAANWDVLVDSPIETGIEKAASFVQDGREYQVTIWGEGNYSLPKIVADLKKVVAQAPSIWDGYPFRKYVFMIHATDGVGGATEHKNSTVIQFPRYLFGPGGRYSAFLSTAAHEFIHTWNVKAYRDAAMVPYHYQKENYSDLLWMHEGSTEYFTGPLLLRAGLIRPDEFLNDLAGVIEGDQNRPGRLVQSVAAGSWDEWIAPADQQRSQNAWINIYDQGLIASWMLDIALLQQTGGKVSYRDVHRELYRRFGSGQRGFTDADVLAILRELTGRPWEAWWATHIQSPVKPDFQALLQPVGLRLTYADAGKPWAGWRGSPSDGWIKLDAVQKGSPAWDAGFEAGDVLVAADRQRLTESRFKGFLAEHKPGDTITVSFFRRDQLMQKVLKVGASKGSPKIVPVDEPTAAQNALLARWLGVPLAS